MLGKVDFVKLLDSNVHIRLDEDNVKVIEAVANESDRNEEGQIGENEKEKSTEKELEVNENSKGMITSGLQNRLQNIDIYFTGVKIEDNVEKNSDGELSDSKDKNIEPEESEKSIRPVTAPVNSLKEPKNDEEDQKEEKRPKPRPKTAPAPQSQEKKIPMDPMRALACLEFVSARGLETADTGPKILANQVRINCKENPNDLNNIKSLAIR